METMQATNVLFEDGYFRVLHCGKDDNLNRVETHYAERRTGTFLLSDREVAKIKGERDASGVIITILADN